jgi:lipopolysaccharide export system permease protein
MKIIDRYIAVHTIRGVLLVLSLFIILFSLMELLSQINDLGKGDYQMGDAFVFVILTIPKRVVDLFPVCMLLGSIIALGVLSDRFELVAMQFSGISEQRICWSVLSIGIIFMLVVMVIAEFVAPTLDQRARIRRSKAIYGKGIMMTKGGFWTRHGSSFIHVGQTMADGQAADVEIYEFDKGRRLSRFIHAREAGILEGQRWQLKDIEQKSFNDQGIQTQKLQSQTLDNFLSSEQVGILELPPDSLSLSDLYGYIRGLEKRGQNAERYALSFWQKLSLPLTILVMMLVALTFIFGHSRNVTAGQRVMLATTAGIALYLINQVIGHVGLLIHLPPALTTLGPVLIIFCISMWLLRKLR